MKQTLSQPSLTNKDYSGKGYNSLRRLAKATSVIGLLPSSVLQTLSKGFWVAIALTVSLDARAEMQRNQIVLDDYSNRVKSIL